MPNEPTPKPADTSKTPSTQRRNLLLGLALLVAAYGVWVIFFVHPGDHLDPLFDHPIFNEFEPNTGLTDLYLPGNVLQIIERQADGSEKPLAFPRLFLQAADCFPNLPLASSPFGLPKSSSGKADASLEIGSENLGRLLPKLGIGNQSAASYTLEVENTQLLSASKSDLSHHFEPLCIAKLRQALADGNQISWFAVVERALVADALRFELDWSTSSSAQGHLAGEHAAEKATEKTEAALAQSAAQIDAVGAAVSTTTNSEKKSTWQLNGRLVLGYDARPLEPVYAELPTVEPVAARLALVLVEGGSSKQVAFDHSFRSGDFFRFEITSEHDAWLTILHRAPGDREAQPLLPAAGAPPMALAGGSTVVVPPRPNGFKFSETTGDETFFIALAATPEASGVEPTTSSTASGELVDIVVRGLSRSLTRTVVLDQAEVAPASSTDQQREFRASEDDPTLAVFELRLRHAAQ